MFCMNCGNPLEEGTKFCTKCGQRVSEEATAQVQEVTTETTAAPVQEAETTNAPQPEAKVSLQKETQEPEAEVQESVAGVAPGVQEAVSGPTPGAQGVAPQPVAGTSQNVEGASDKVKKFPKGALIVVAALAVVLVLVLANFKVVANSVNKMVSSPEKYYAQVEKNEIKELASTMAESYNNLFLENINFSNYGLDYSMEVELGEEAYSMLGSALELEDGSAFSKMALNFMLSIKGDSISAGADASLGKNQLISAKAVADLGKGEAYAEIPELTNKAIGVSIADYTAIIKEVLKKGDEFLALCPDKKAVEKLLNRYLAIAVENIDSIKEDKDTITVGNIEQKCTVIRVRIKENDVYKVAKAVCTAAKDDKELMDIVAAFAVAYGGMDESEARKSFEEAITLALEELAKYEEEAKEDVKEEILDIEDSNSEEEIRMYVWVNNKGEVIGRELRVGDSKFVYQMPMKGNDFEFQAKVVSDGDTVLLEGTGKKSSSSLSGEFALKMKEDEEVSKLMDITVEELDTKKIKQGYVNGSFILKPAQELLEQTDLGTISVLLTNFSVKVEAKTGKSSAEVVMTLLNKDDMFAKLTANTKIGSGKSASLPGKGILVEDEEDIIEWAKTIDFEKFTKNLSKAGLPKEMLETIEDACEDLEDVISMY